jgi:hypothetical protein
MNVPENLFTGPGFFLGLFLGILIGWVTLWSFLNPAVGRIVIRIVAVVVIGFGVNWIVTPLIDAANDVPNPRYESPLGHGGYGPAFGWGAGGLAAGIMALVFSFLRGKKMPPREANGKAPEAAVEKSIP